MKQLPIVMISLSLFSATLGRAQTPGLDLARLKATNVTLTAERLSEREVVKVVKSPLVTAFDEATFAKITDFEFQNGTIEVKVLSRLLPDAPDFARGFIGVAFRINGDDTRFECIYLRPTNGRADDQLRRNRALQYFSYPDFKFDRLRKEAPGIYEAYADMGLDEWITVRIEVSGAKAKLFLNDGKHPALVVNELKHGETAGAIGLWVDIGTEGFFTDLNVRKD